MKFPKLPGLSKLPKLPNFSKLLKKGSGDDDDSDDDDDFDEASEDAGKIAPSPSGGGDDDDFDDDDFDDDDDEDGEGKGSRKLLMIIAAGSFVLLAGIIGGAGWWYFGDASDAPAKTAQKPDNAAKGPRVRMAMPAKPGSLNSLLSPPPGEIVANRGRPSGAAGKKPAMTLAASGPAKAAAAQSMRAHRAGDIGGKFGGQANPLSGSLNAIGGDIQGAGIGVVIPAVTSVTIRNLPDHPGSKPLGPVPDARLVEKKEGLPGMLPITGKDGSMPWEVYARPYEAEDDRPKVAIVIIGLGLSRAATRAAIRKLPPEITLVLDPYAKGLGDWLVRARLAGHEVMVALPMESERFPIHDAGPFSMDTGLKVEDNLKRLDLVLSQFTGYIGVATVMGSRFGTSESLLRPVLEVLKERGLMLVTTGTQETSAVPKIAFQIGLPRVISDVTLDDEPSRAAITAKLERLEEIARERSVGVAIARPYPATIDRLIAWTRSLEGKKMVLVPVSAVADTTQKKKKE